MLTKQEFILLFDEFCSYYNKKGLAKNALALQAWVKLRDLCPTSQDLKALFIKAIEEFRFFPSPTEVMSLVDSKEVEAIEEWTQLVHALKSNQERSYTPQAEKAIASLGGLTYLASLSTDQLYQKVESRFIQRWVQYQRALNNGSVAPSIYLESSTNLSVEPEPEMTPEMRAELWAAMKSLLRQMRN